MRQILRGQTRIAGAVARRGDGCRGCGGDGTAPVEGHAGEALEPGLEARQVEPGQRHGRQLDDLAALALQAQGHAGLVGEAVGPQEDGAEIGHGRVARPAQPAGQPQQVALAVIVEVDGQLLVEQQPAMAIGIEPEAVEAEPRGEIGQQPPRIVFGPHRRPLWEWAAYGLLYRERKFNCCVQKSLLEGEAGKVPRAASRVRAGSRPALIRPGRGRPAPAACRNSCPPACR